MPAPPKPRSRFVPLLLIGAASLLLGGCVYLRLLEFKKQLGHFDENFVVLQTEDLSIRCLHPVLQSDDLRWLGAAPKTIVPHDGDEDWLVRWVKEPAPGSKEEFVYDMELAASFTDDRLTMARIPSRYLAYVSKDVILNMLHSTGTAKVNRDSHEAEARTAAPAATPMPNLGTIKAMMGEPTRRDNSPGLIIYFYRYRLDSENTSIKPVEISFTFGADNGQLLKFTARLPHGTLNYDFTPRGPSKPVPPKSAQDWGWHGSKAG